jgi:hypothetical protein
MSAAGRSEGAEVMTPGLRQGLRAVALGLMLSWAVGPATAVDPGVGVGAPGPGLTRGVGAPGVGARDPGLNQPGRAGNVGAPGAGAPGVGVTPGRGVGAPGVGAVDPGLNQPGVAGNVGGVARRSARL